MVADCLPILLTDRSGSCVGAAHAGWRGLAGGVIANTVARMPAPAADLMAWIGPGIGPDAFEVGEDVREAFCAAAPERRKAFRPLHPGKWLCDLPALARDALHRAGVTRVYGGTLCTYSDAQRFYSYRRDRITGRMAALIWRDAQAAAPDTV
jgi:YfiH family protein